MSSFDHVKVIDKKVTELSDALAHLGKGTDLKELLRIIKNPGWTTPAEFAFVTTIVDSMQVQVKALASLNTQLVAASKLVSNQPAVSKSPARKFETA